MALGIACSMFKVDYMAYVSLHGGRSYHRRSSSVGVFKIKVPFLQHFFMVKIPLPKPPKYVK